MAYFEHGNISLYYTDHGEGEPIITLHGLSESGLYWTLPGITDRLVAAGYRVINMDMRAHGGTRIRGRDRGYNVETMAGDIGLLADSLGLERFHLLTHATGGMVGFRYAMQHCDRLLSVMATDTGSATLPSDEAAALTDPDVELPQVRIGDLAEGRAMIDAFRFGNWETIHRALRQQAAEHVFFNSMHRAVQPESAWAMYEACSVRGSPGDLAEFVESFYTDLNPQIAGLRGISCPCLMILGEYDVQFIQPAELVAREVPHCTHRLLEGMGHMLAFENPKRLGDELLSFLKSLSHSAQ